VTPEELIEAFDTLAEAPNGIERLRELVLQLAVRGKLVPQDPEDEPASVLLERIAEEKERLVREGKIRKRKPLPPVSEDEVPFDVPEGWRWCRLATMVPWDLTDGDWVESKDQDPTGAVRLTQLADVGMNAFLDKSERFLTTATATRLNCTYLEPGDILIARLPRPLGRACIFPGVEQPAITVVDVAIARCREVGPSNRFLVHVLNSHLVRDQVENLAAGTTRKRISTGNLRKTIVPLPPIAEQHRIVVKVDELMTLIDQLEAARNAREDTRAALRDAALAALQDADTPEEVEAAWNRIAERMDDLFTGPADIDPLRQTILQLAVRGRLVPQDPNDEPASVLLERIADEKERLVKEGKIRKPKPLPPVSAVDVPFEIPEGWAWTRFGVITDCRLGKMLDRGKNTGPPRPYLRNANVQWFEFVLDDLKELRLEESELPEYSLAAGDLVICEGGEPGRAAVCDESVSGMVFQKALHRVRPLCGTDSWYLAYVLRCEARSGRLAESFTGATIKHLTGRSLALFSVPLPPLAEQHRIVAKVDELMALLDRLEERLKNKTAAHDAFAAAAVQGLSP